MDKFKGTPGPFKACTAVANWYGFENRFFEVVDKDNMIVAFVKDWTGAGETPKLDAKLLAAAPELLEALRQLRDYAEDVCGVCPDDCNEEHPLMLATTAINKALGK
ncbi:hypothetical protein [Huaxiibacter chinensis]|uniref:hypothetical protein n=1 Tax=Huaxiibacter chinensis TaxID=2899785 RepID=UPI003D312027